MNTWTLTYLVRGRKVLLGWKKRGPFVNTWNGFGGGVEHSETPMDGALREVREECGVQPLTLVPSGILLFDNSAINLDGVVYLFRCPRWKGTVAETEEMKPKYFDIYNLPLSEMLEADRVFAYPVMTGRTVNGTFSYRHEKLVACSFSMR